MWRLASHDSFPQTVSATLRTPVPLPPPSTRTLSMSRSDGEAHSINAESSQPVIVSASLLNRMVILAAAEGGPAADAPADAQLDTASGRNPIVDVETSSMLGDYCNQKGKTCNRRGCSRPLSVREAVRGEVQCVDHRNESNVAGEPAAHETIDLTGEEDDDEIQVRFHSVHRLWVLTHPHWAAPEREQSAQGPQETPKAKGRKHDAVPVDCYIQFTASSDCVHTNHATRTGTRGR